MKVRCLGPPLQLLKAMEMLAYNLQLQSEPQRGMMQWQGGTSMNDSLHSKRANCRRPWMRFDAARGFDKKLQQAQQKTRI